MMRLVAVHLLLLAGLAIHLCLGGVQADSNIFLYRGDSPNITPDGEGGLSSGGNADNIAATNILGRDNLCVDVRDGRYDDGNPIQLWPCGNAKLNQLWTFGSDGTIRSNGKCMTTCGYSVSDHVMIYDCGSAVAAATKWTLDYSGTIRNPQSGLVLTARLSTPGSTLTVNVDTNSSAQAWTPVNYTIPAITYIRGFRELCLQANGVDPSSIGLANCIIALQPRQQWALYGDRTIRLYSNRSLCVTSNGHNSLDRIVLLPWRGNGNQRWTFMDDGTILNPNAGLVMDVREGDFSLQQIILYKHTGKPNQKWRTFY